MQASRSLRRHGTPSWITPTHFKSGSFCCITLAIRCSSPNRIITTLTPNSKRVLVIGGSVAGLMTASLLRKAGWEVAVFERAVGDLTGRGAGLGVSEELVQVMERAGARFETSAGVVQRSMAWMERDGHVAFEHPRFMVASAWARVYQPLRDALPR